MARLLRVPAISAGASEAVLATWPLAENVPYAATDVIATVETEKAVVDIEAEEDGVILRRLVGEGANVAVGQPIALLGAPGEPAGDIDEMLRAHGVAAGPPPAAPTAPAAPAAPAGSPVSSAPSAGSPASGADLVRAAPAGNGQPQGPGPHDAEQAGALQAGALRAGAQRIFVSPLARRLARDSALDLRAIAGTGPNGRIMRRDVEQAMRAIGRAPAAATGWLAEPALQPSPAVTTGTAEGAAAGWPTPVAPAAPPAAAGHTAIAHSRVRQAIASRLTESKRTVPHFYLSGSARAGKLLRLRAELNDGTSPVRVSVNDLVVKAVARAHQLVPAMNVIWTPEALLSYSSVDVGVAVASPRGRVTPGLRSAARYPISALSAAVADLVDRAGAGRLQQRELEGGTTCVTNLGMFGVEEFSAIINPPQSSIIAVGAIHDAPVVKKGKLGVGAVMRVTLSVDHRAADGTTAAEWMKAFVALIEHPAQILA